MLWNASVTSVQCKLNKPSKTNHKHWKEPSNQINMLSNPIRCITQLDDQFPVHDRKKLAPVLNIKNSLNKILKKVLVVKKNNWYVDKIHVYIQNNIFKINISMWVQD